MARALAAEIGTDARFEWLAPHTESFEQVVLEGRCHAAMGISMDPEPMAGDRTVPGVALTLPYYGTGYLLIRRAGAPGVRTLAELGEQRIAVERESIAPFTLRQQPWVPLLAAGKAAVEAAAAAWYFYQMPAKERAWCGYCILGALANVGIFALTLPEAGQTFTALRRPQQGMGARPDPQ